ncbi:MAG: hypothetical protein JWM27_3067 [Gemmatimonadetes bacterium]|nr:hypothetical protein [Gemmatimonadota bacterium]
MHSPQATLEDLRSLLPRMEELEVLRLLLAERAAPDPEKAWDSSTAFATIDKRIMDPASVDGALADAEQTLQRFIARVFAGLRPVFDAYWAGRPEDAARHLVALGERLEGDGWVSRARSCYDVALSLVLPVPDKATQILALRRVARVALALGGFHEAESYYQRSVELALDSGDLQGQVVGRTGLGNVCLHKGRFAQAESRYLEALRLAEGLPAEGHRLERAQLYSNVGNMVTRQGRLEEAEAWFARAFELYAELDAPYDLGVAYLSQAHLLELQGRPDEAVERCRRALTLSIPSGLRAVIATDLAGLVLGQGHVTTAEEWAREAEEHAIRSQSPYSMGHMYLGRGNIARERGDVDGFTFYEKALEIAREKGYSSLEGETLLEYALLRSHNGGAEEARAYLERAREIFQESGSVQHLRRVEGLLADMADIPEPAGVGD